MGQDKFCTVTPFFRASDRAAVDALRALYADFVEHTSIDPNAPYYGFGVAGTEVSWQESYADADTVLATLGAPSLLTAALTIADLARLEVRGPASELAVLRTRFRSVAPPVFIESTESRHERWLRRTRPTLDYIDSMPIQRRTAVDAGAAEGLITTWLADRFDLVHAFEPLPEHFTRLINTDWRGRVICHQLALGDRPEYRMMEGIGHSSRLAVAARAEGTRVRVCRLDSFDISNLDLIKIDVEGFETQVITGASALIARFKPAVMFERKKRWTAWDNRENPQSALEACGYRVVFKGPLDTVMVYHGPAEADRR